MLGLTAHWACCVSDQWQFAKEMGRKQVFEKPLSAEPGCVKRGGRCAIDDTEECGNVYRSLH